MTGRIQLCIVLYTIVAGCGDGNRDRMSDACTSGCDEWEPPGAIEVFGPGAFDEISQLQLTLVDLRVPDRPLIIDVPTSNERARRQFAQLIEDGVFIGRPSEGVALQFVRPEADRFIGLFSTIAGGLEDFGDQRSDLPYYELNTWRFFIPKDGPTSFPDDATEVCDASFEHLEENLDTWFASVGHSVCFLNVNHKVKEMVINGRSVFRVREGYEQGFSYP